jgi:putative Mn2+ efflux pump MntP
LKLPPQLIWKFAHEPELLGWTIRARNYSTFIADCAFAFLIIIHLGLTYAAHHSPTLMESSVMDMIISAGFFSILAAVTASMTHQRMNFAYRLSKSGIGYCEWKDFPQWALTFLKWLTVLAAIIFLFLATIDPSFLIGALVGPGGMGLMYLRMASSKSYQDMQSEYHHHEYKWEEITQLAIATNRDIVDLKYHMGLHGEDPSIHWNFNIFCKRNQKEQVAKFIKPYLASDVPFIRVKLDTLLSTDTHEPVSVE